MIFAGLLPAHRRFRPKPSLGPRRAWLRGHLWIGLLSVPLILCHASYRLGGLLEQILMAVFAIVILSGLFGVLLQQFLPRLMTSRATAETPYEQIPHVLQIMRRKTDKIIEDLCGPMTDSTFSLSSFAESTELRLHEKTTTQLRQFYEERIRPLLFPRVEAKDALRDPLQVEAVFQRLIGMPELASHKKSLEEMEGLIKERMQLFEQERIHHWLHSWLMAHIPLSIVLLVLGVAHIITALMY